MSFSSEVKQELSKLSNLANKQIVKFELLGYLATSHVTFKNTAGNYPKIKFSTGNEYNINRFSKLLNNLQFTNYEIRISGNQFSITLPAPQLEEVTYSRHLFELDREEMKNQMENQEELRRAFIRGVFLSGGSINNPENSYHLEMTFSRKRFADFTLNILKDYDISFKMLQKELKYSIYAKDGEEISKFLAFIGANQSVLKFEEIRVYRDVRNQVNRKVNCETANLNKIVDSALKQIEAISYLKQIGELQNLSQGLQEIAELRVSHPEASLQELGEMLPVPLGKSGVNHRLKAIEKMAEELKSKT